MQKREKKILLVDDEPDIRLIGRKILEKEGYEVILAASGGDALVHLRKEKNFSLLIVDYHMPGIEGEELFREILKLDGIPVLVVTGDYLEQENTLID